MSLSLYSPTFNVGTRGTFNVETLSYEHFFLKVKSGIFSINEARGVKVAKLGGDPY